MKTGNNYAPLTGYTLCSVTGHLDTGFSWFPCVYKQMLKWFPRIQAVTNAFHVALPT